MKKYLLGGAAAVVFAAIAPALAQAPVQAPRAKVIARADVTAKVQQHFVKVDANRDGVITQDEVKATESRMGKRGNRQGHKAGGEGFFTRLDTNRDGNVTRAEFDAARAARAQQQAARQGDRGQAMFTRFDTNRDGAISQSEFDAARQQWAAQGRPEGHRGERGMHMAGFGQHMFAMADANRDGRLTLPEATAAAVQHFDMADTNHDGQLTPEERQQMRGKMHTQH